MTQQAPTFFLADDIREDLDHLRRISEAAPMHIEEYRRMTKPETIDEFHKRMATQILALPNYYYIALMSLYGGPVGHARNIKIIRSGTRRRVNPDFAWELALLVGFSPDRTGLDTWTIDPTPWMGRSIHFQQYYSPPITAQHIDPLPRRMPPTSRRPTAGGRGG